MRRPGCAATTSTSAATLAAAVGWSTPRPPCASRRTGRRSSAALHEDPLARARATRAVHLRGPEDRHGRVAVEQHALGGDLVRAVALAAVEVAVARRHRRLRLADRPVEARRVVGVRVVPGRVHVDGLARDHHRGAGVARERQERARVHGREAGAVDDELGTGAVRRAQVLVVGTVTGHEAGARRGERARHARRVTAGERRRSSRPRAAVARSLARSRRCRRGSARAARLREPRRPCPPARSHVWSPLPAASVAARCSSRSRSASECSGSWWNSSRRRAPTAWANATASSTLEWPQPIRSPYSSGKYCASWKSRSASSPIAAPEIHVAWRGHRCL